jgi:phosphate starvation-inducible protein PhoH
MTRVGENCKVILCGDFRQSDLRSYDAKKNLLTFGSIIDRMSCFTKVEFGIEDIVRSNFVKKYIISKLESGFV